MQKFIDEAVEEALSVKYQDGESADVHSFMDALIKETREPRVLRDQLLNVMLAGQENAKEDEYLHLVLKEGITPSPRGSWLGENHQLKFLQYFGPTLLYQLTLERH